MPETLQKNQPTPIQNVAVEPIESPTMEQRPITESTINAFDDGYDTDGEMGPFNDAVVAEGEQLLDENSVPEIANTVSPTNTSGPFPPNTPAAVPVPAIPIPPSLQIDVFIPIEQEVLDAMKV